MDLTSLPGYPTPQRQGHPVSVRKANPGLPPRATRVLRDLVLLVVIIVLLYWLRRTATAIEYRPQPQPPRPPLDFKLIEERFGQLRIFASPEDVDELLGPPAPSLNPLWEVDLRDWTQH